MTHDRDKFKDPEYAGHDYEAPKELREGPMAHRKCTDVLCAIIFTMFCAAMLGCSAYGWFNGQPGKLLAGIDSDGHFCGYDSGYEDYPYLFIWDISLPAENVDDTFVSAICVSECPFWDNTTKTYEMECHPTNYTVQELGTNSSCNYTDRSMQYNSVPYIGKYCVPVYSSLSNSTQSAYDNILSSFSGSSTSQYFSDVMESEKVIFICIAMAFFVSWLYIVVLKYTAKILAWISLLVILASLIGIGAYAWVTSSEYQDGDDTGTALKGFAIGVWIVAALYFLAIICMWHKLQIAIAVLEAAADFVSSTKRIIVVPVFFFFVQLIAFVMWCAGLFCVYSIGTIETVSSGGDEYRTISWNESTRNMVYFQFFGVFWIIAFIIACSQWVVIVACCTWYFSHGSDTKGSASIRKGFRWIFEYHLGSLAFGSFIIALVYIIRLIFEYVAKKLKDAAGENWAVKCMICCCRCMLDCVDRFVKFITKNAYIQVALTSDNFCTAAMNGFCLILKYAGEFGFTTSIGEVFMFLGKMAISSSVTFSGFLMIGHWTSVKENVQSPTAPCVLIFMLSYVISSIFISVYSIASNAILQCFLVDTDISKQEGKEDAHQRPESLNEFIVLTRKDKGDRDHHDKHDKDGNQIN